MPCLEITIPRITSQTKATLAKSLTSAFVAASGFPEKIFGIKFNLYELADAATGGVLCSESDERPYIHFVLYCPRIKKSVKQDLVAQLSGVYTSVVGKESWGPVIHICEHPYDNVGVDGKLLSDSHEQCAKTAFYYGLADE